jgi:hypothetical protein
VIYYVNKNRIFTRVSVVNKTIDGLNTYFGKSCHHQGCDLPKYLLSKSIVLFVTLNLVNPPFLS